MGAAAALSLWPAASLDHLAGAAHDIGGGRGGARGRGDTLGGRRKLAAAGGRDPERGSLHAFGFLGRKDFARKIPRPDGCRFVYAAAVFSVLVFLAAHGTSASSG